jgi:hypothetical protein
VVDIKKRILAELRNCPAPDDARWPAAYERIAGAAACLLAAFPTFPSRSKAVMDRYHTDVRLRLPDLLSAAAANVGVEFHMDPLKWWSCGLFFNTAISRVANALEKTLATGCETHQHGLNPYVCARCHLQTLPPAAAEARKSLAVFAALPPRAGIDQAVINLVAALDGAVRNSAGSVEDFDAAFSAHPNLYRTAAITFMWRDANAQKHRVIKARGGVGSSDPTRDPRVQFVFGLRSYVSLCAVYAALRSTT